ncbi:MAG: GTPase ObgE [Chloroflexi bacterium]|nr:MAG: GTPase ObgE [Chloroflexota bacterium]
MFFDQAKIYVRSGNGGDGMISFRREKFVPYGGPDGGDGGNGGEIIFYVDKNINSLVKYHRNVHYRAEHGKHGGKARRTGARGETLRLPVPPGTMIRNAETGDLLADLTRSDQEAIVLTGGRGGRGNIHYTSSRNQAPRLAERGEPGEELWLNLELKLIADVGLVGLPNAGKSTLLSVISGAKPKIANYPFTTLQPSLGVVNLDGYETMIVADIPGLIEGAAEGIGLGHEFLRHIERCRVLIHLLDGSAKEPLEDWATINQELALYHTTLGISLDERPQLVVLNKMDLDNAIAWEPLVKEEIEKAGYEFKAISALTKQNVREMLYQVKQMLDEAPEPLMIEDEEIVIRAEEDEDSFTIERVQGGWRVQGKKIERIAAMTYFEFEPTANRFSQTLESMGISKALEEAGVQVGDLVFIGEEELEWIE